MVVTYTTGMTYQHREYPVIPIVAAENDVEPMLEALDPTGANALDHLITGHPDLFRVCERIAYETAPGDSELKMRVLIAMSRIVGYIEQRPQ